MADFGRIQVVTSSAQQQSCTPLHALWSCSSCFISVLCLMNMCHLLASTLHIAVYIFPAGHNLTVPAPGVRYHVKTPLAMLHPAAPCSVHPCLVLLQTM